MSELLRTAAQDRLWLRKLWHGAAYVKHELANPRALNLSQRMRLLRQGFWSESYALCALDREDHADFVSDWAHIYRCRYLNGPHWLLLEDKLWWNRLMQPFRPFVPEIFGTVISGRFHPLCSEFALGRDAQAGASGWLDLLLERHGVLVMKPIRGGRGHGVHVLRSQGGRWLWDGWFHPPDTARQRVAGLHDYIVMAFVQQHPYAAEIFPHSTNTMRILTLIDPDTHEPFVAAAVHRIGTARSVPTDNVSGGGMSSAICLETGELGPAAITKTRTLQLAWHKRHPETNAEITGTAVPNWRQVHELVLSAAQYLSFCPYIGWDMVVTKEEPGLSFIEANDHPWTHVHQIHGGLLRDPRVRRFYEYHGVV